MLAGKYKNLLVQVIQILTGGREGKKLHSGSGLSGLFSSVRVKITNSAAT